MGGGRVCNHASTTFEHGCMCSGEVFLKGGGGGIPWAMAGLEF